MRLSTILCSLAALTLSAVPLAAEGHEGHEGRCHEGHEGHESRGKLMERFDTNKDGKLDETERAAAKAAMQEHRKERVAKILAKHPELDSNGDGSLDQSERKAARAAFLAKHPEADKNGDGKIDCCERKDLRQEHRGEHGKKGDHKAGDDK